MNLEVKKEQEELEAQTNDMDMDEQDMDVPTAHQVFYPAQVDFPKAPVAYSVSSCLN